MKKYFKIIIGLLFITSFTFAFKMPSIYPWNANLSGYYTFGDYSNGSIYSSQAVYFSMDRRLKERFIVAFEQMKIKTNGAPDYIQYNVLARDMFWIKPYLQIGGMFGKITSPTLDHGWIVGAQISGNTKWFGYGFSTTQSDYDSHISHEGGVSDYFYPDSLDYYTDFIVYQKDYSILRSIKNHTFQFLYSTQDIEENSHAFYSAFWTYTPHDYFVITAGYGQGESRFSVNPYSLLINNNPSLLENFYSLKNSLRVHTNWTINLVYSLHNYENSLNIEYYAIGIQGRF
jgi:hypothetical protein